MNCQRTGCKDTATHAVLFHIYPRQGPTTKACLEHARWWSKGINGEAIGTAIQLKGTS